MKKIVLVILAISVSFRLLAQDTKGDAQNLGGYAAIMRALNDTSPIHWKKGGTISLSGQEISLSNWSAGGQNAISAGSLLSLYSNYHKGKIIWDNNFDLAYGTIKQQGNKHWWKTDDRIQLTSKFGRYAFKHAYYSTLLDFKSQFAPGYNYPNDSTKISNFLAPAYVVLALGMDFEIDSGFSAFVAPATGRFTIVKDDSLAKYGAFGVQKEVVENGVITQHYKKFRAQFGGYVKIQYSRQIMPNVTFTTMAEFFSDYFNHPENLYINWTTLTSMKVNKWISATFNTQLIYDPAVQIKQADGTLKGPRVQFKQVLNVGFSYKF